MSPEAAETFAVAGFALLGIACLAVVCHIFFIYRPKPTAKPEQIGPKHVQRFYDTMFTHLGDKPNEIKVCWADPDRPTRTFLFLGVYYIDQDSFRHSNVGLWGYEAVAVARFVDNLRKEQNKSGREVIVGSDWTKQEQEEPTCGVKKNAD